jgi:hypothetical protein
MISNMFKWILPLSSSSVITFAAPSPKKLSDIITSVRSEMTRDLAAFTQVVKVFETHTTSSVDWTYLKIFSSTMTDYIS